MKRKQVNKSKEMFQIIKDYSEYSSIQGLIYIFMSQQTGVGRLFWILIVILMLMLGTYWSSNAYDSWQNDPVLTTVKSTAFPVTHVRLCFIKLSNYEFNRVQYIDKNLQYVNVIQHPLYTLQPHLIFLNSFELIITNHRLGFNLLPPPQTFL